MIKFHDDVPVFHYFPIAVWLVEGGVVPFPDFAQDETLRFDRFIRRRCARLVKHLTWMSHSQNLMVMGK